MQEDIVIIIYIFFVSLYLHLVLHGFGKYLIDIVSSKFLNAKIQGNEIIFMQTWLGLVLLVPILFLVHIILPIDWKISIGIFFLALPGLYVSNKENPIFGVPLLLLMICLVAFLAVFLVLYHQHPGDYGLYHFQLARLAGEYPTITGLVNVHGRYGVVSGLYNVISLGSFFPFGFRQVVFTAPTVYFLTLFLASLLYFAFKKKIDDYTFSSNVFIGLSVFVVITVARKYYYILDIFVLLIGFLFGYFILFFIHAKETKQAKKYFIFLLCLGVIGSMFKLSFAVFSGTGIVIAGIVLLRSKEHVFLFKSIGLAFLLCVPYVIANIINSGFLIFPVKITNLGFQWSNLSAAIDVNEAVTGWARAPGSGYRDALVGWDWVPGWLHRMAQKETILTALVLTVIALGVLVRAHFIKRHILDCRKFFICLVPVLVGLVFWFLMMPSDRFSGALFFLPAAFILAFSTRDQRHTKKSTMISVLLCIFIVSMIYGAAKTKSQKYITIYDVPQAPMQTRETSSGLLIYYPTKGGQVWDTSLFPSTPYFNKNLSLMGAEIEDGFYIKKEN